WLGPLVEVGGYIFVVVCYFVGLLSFWAVVLFFLFAIGFGILLSVTSLLLEELTFHTYPKVRHILLLFLAVICQNLGYRQLNSFWRLKGLLRWMLGRKAEWGEMTRVATWQAEANSERRPAK